MASAQEMLTDAWTQHQAGNLPQAEQLYRQLVSRWPNSADAWHLLGALCIQTKRPAEAVPAIQRAIQLNPNNADYYSHLGAALGDLGQHDESIKNLRHAVRLAPQSASVHYNLGTALQNDKQLESAVVSFRHAVAAEPTAAEAHYNLANALRDLKQYDEAAARYRAAIAARPNYLKALLNLGGVLNDLQRRDEAIAVLRQAAALAPQHPRAHLNLGSVLRDAGHFAEAVAELQLATQLDPTSAEAYNNLGTAYQTQARYDDARQCYERALELDPQLSDAHFSLATQLLREGDMQRGFAEYLWRWKCRGFSVRPFEQPTWDGSSLAGRTILLYAEQGLGDTLHFVRYAGWAKERGGRVIVECQPALKQLLALCPHIDEVLALGEPLPGFDVQAPLLDLPGILNLEVDDLWAGPYIIADAERVQRWRSRLEQFEGLRIGLCWQGNTQHLFDSQRSLSLEKFAPLAQISGVQLVSLQKGGDLLPLGQHRTNVHSFGAELDADGPFLDTAAIMQSLDLVISVDTAVAHLAGALEVPLWIPLSAHGDWRWMSNRDDSPWYPSVRLFRQSQLDDWDNVVTRLATHLKALFESR